MTARTRLRIGITAIVAIAWIGVGSAEAEIGELYPDDASVSLSGSYLAGRSADTAQDIQAAAEFFSAALSHDPDNPILLERVLVLDVANGEVEDAIRFADRLITYDPANPVARLVRGAYHLKQGDFEAARSELDQTAEAPLAVLTSGLLKAWAIFGLGQADEALATIDGLSGPSWYQIFKDFHTASIASLSGQDDKAAEAITRAFDADGSALRIVEGYGRILARTGHRDEAIAGLATFLAERPNEPIISGLFESLKAGITPDPVVIDAATGAAEVLYGIGTAIGTDQGTELPTAYLQLARYLNDGTDLTLVALGDLFFISERCADAIETYSLVPDSSRLNRNADIQTGLCLDNLDRTDEAAAQIQAVIDADPDDLEAVIALGNIYRGRDRFAEAANVYEAGIKTIEEPAPSDWRLYYFQGVSLERSKRWDEAEAALKKALELNPEQPQVLNYLGYSWVDQGINLDEGMDMIRAAVDQRPNDGYIVDSLGWAYYRLGQYEEAVKQLERAVELRPDDPVINDHLGDAYWRVGRKREATFQWNHARDLDPEPADLEKIVNKLERGIAVDVGNDG